MTASCAAKAPVSVPGGITADEAVRKVALLDGGVRSVKGLARVRISTPEEKISYTQVTVAEAPDRIRLEALNPFGSTVGFISSDGRETYIVSSSERAKYDASEEFDLSYVYPGLDLRINAANLVNLVLGRLPYPMPGNEPVMTEDGGRLKLDFSGAEGAYTLWADPRTFRVVKAEFALPGGGTGRASYEYFSGLISGHYFPQKIDFETGSLSISISYEPGVEVNVPVDASLFRPQAFRKTIENISAQNYN